jgi:hypothetical protein
MFARLIHGCNTGSGLVIELPFLTCARMTEVFGKGAGMAMQRKEKYSGCISVRHQTTGEDLHLYMANGEWRIGGSKNCSVIGELMEMLCPHEYPGFSDLSPQAIFERCDHGVPKTEEVA